MAWKECVICGVGFDAKGSDKTCSKQCSNRVRADRKREEKRREYQDPEKRAILLAKKRKDEVCECVVCSKPFLKRGQSKTCSKECSKRLDRIRENDRRKRKRQNETDAERKNRLEKLKRYPTKYRPVEPKEKECVECGKIFAAKWARKYCCYECQRENSKSRQRERYANDPKLREESRSRLKRHYYENPEYWKEKKKKDNEYPVTWVRSALKEKLGFTPPPDLVEEATALRLLNRALREID